MKLGLPFLIAWSIWFMWIGVTITYSYYNLYIPKEIQKEQCIKDSDKDIIYKKCLKKYKI